MQDDIEPDRENADEPVPRLAARRRSRLPEKKQRGPFAMIGLNLALLAFLAFVVQRIILPELRGGGKSTAAPDVSDLVTVADGFVAVSATGARIPLVPPPTSKRIVFIGDWSSALGKDPDGRALDGVSILMAAVLGGQSLDIVVLDAPGYRLSDAIRLVSFSARLRPSLVALVPSARTPSASDGASLSAALRDALGRLASEHVPVAVWGVAPEIPDTPSIAVESGAAFFDTTLLGDVSASEREAAAADWLSRNL